MGIVRPFPPIEAAGTSQKEKTPTGRSTCFVVLVLAQLHTISRPLGVVMVMVVSEHRVHV
jgi:hypothetical protein